MADLPSHSERYKVVLVGEAGVGKTALFRRLKSGIFDEHASTLGIDNFVKDYRVGDVKVELMIWDTGGVERFRSATTQLASTYRDAHAAVFVYSVDDPASLHYLTSWLQDLESFGPRAVKFLVGNKIDLPGDEVQIDECTRETFGKTNGFKEAFQTSAKTGRGVDEAFFTVARVLFAEDNDIDPDPETVDPTVGLDQPEAKSCCSVI